MKIAISALGDTLDARVDERFGRAKYLIVVDPDTLEFEAVDNSTNANAMQGAGIAAAEVVSSRGAQAVVTGHLGPKAMRALSAVDIAGYDGTGMSVRDAVLAFGKDDLVRLTEAPAHTGLQ